jgi:predicted PurR-regulated permease PerM
MSQASHENRFWLFVAAFFLAAVWLLKPILLPFVAGLVIAYFLDPAVDRLSGWRVPRWLGTLMVLIGFISVVVMIMLLIVPLLQGQVVALMDALPGYIAQIKASVLPRVETFVHRLSPEDVQKLQDAAGSYAGDAAMWIGQFARKIIAEGFALFDVATLLVITPVVAFYLLRDWPRVRQTVSSLVPRKKQGVVREAVHEIDRTLSGFLRGQALVCLCLGLIYGIGLTLTGLKYGATVGIVAGFLSFIPYVGSTFGLVVSMILAFIQFDDWGHIGAVLGVFLLGQGLEGYVLTPKLVGDRVGLHPVWILFALFAGGSLLGFAGILIAVPVAAVIGVLLRLGIRHYKDSRFYKHSDQS